MSPPLIQWNLPNQITVFRLVISLLVFILIPLGYYVPALVAFSIAAGTDWLDGYLARKHNVITQLGRILDPFADKILICGVFILLGAIPHSGIAAWMAVVVVGREMLVTALRSFMEQRGSDFSAQMAGKLKMVFQCASAIISLLLVAHTSSAPPTWLPPLARLAAWLAVISTVYSGIGYILTAMRLVRSP